MMRAMAARTEATTPKTIVPAESLLPESVVVGEVKFAMLEVGIEMAV